MWGGLGYLTRCHGVKVISSVSVEECCLSVGEVVGHGEFCRRPRLNNTIVMFLSSVDKATKLVEHRLVLDGSLTSVLTLLKPSKKVTILNVPALLAMIF